MEPAKSSGSGASLKSRTIWEEATAGREIIIENRELKSREIHGSALEALQSEAEKVDASKIKGKSATYATTSTMAPISTLTAEDVAAREYLKAHIKSDFKNLSYENDGDGESHATRIGSSLPHLSPFDHQTKRAAHVTSSRVVGSLQVANVNYVVHERFHQDQGPQKDAGPPSHDRFFATDPTGEVYLVKGVFEEKSSRPLNSKKLQEAKLLLDGSGRSGPLIESSVAPFVTWKLGSKNDTAPPLSPRSITRTLPDTAYGLPDKGHSVKK
jgi:hypothetical protein